MTFQKAFDAVKKKFGNAVVNDVTDFALQVTLSDEDCGGTFYIAVQGGVLDVAPYDYQDNTAVLDISKTNFTSLLSGKKSLQKVVEEGASLKGDASAIDSIKAIAATVKKAPAKKAAPKAAEAKAPAAKKATAATKTAAKATAIKETKTAAKATAIKETKTAAAKKAAPAAKKTTAKKTTAIAEKKTK